MTEASQSFKLKNDPSELNTLFQKLENLCIQLGLSKRCQCEIDLVLEELFTNIVAHGYPDDDEHWIEISISHKSGVLVIRIVDDGVPFNPAEFEATGLDTPLEERGVGGLGVHLARYFTEDVVYERRGNKNILTLTKFLVA
jgi:serine/threonine-protein kinase RsbW